MRNTEPENTPDNRRPIWSVTPDEQAAHFTLFITFMAAGVTFLICYELFVEQNRRALPIIRLLVLNLANTGVGAAIAALATTEIRRSIMVIARYLEEKLVKPQREKLIKQGREQRDAAWQEWLERMEQARENGEPFNDPPPNRR